MKALIDGLNYFINTGDVGEYTRGLLNNLKQKDDDSISIIKDKEIVNNQILSNGIKIKEIYINRVNMNYKSISDLINSTKCEIYHCTNNGFSLQSEYRYNCKVVVTVHNIIPEFYEDFYNTKYLEKYYYSMQLWDKMSDKIICPSTYIKDELISKFGINEEKIQIILPKVHKNFIKQSNYVSKVYLKSKFNFSGEFILYCGELHRRKRIEEFLEVFLSLSNRHNDLYFLILCNINNVNYDYYNELNILIKTMNLGDRAIFITSYTKNDKIHFYNTTKAVVDFSLYEGLNISLLEAKSCGANIVCSDIRTFRELLNDYPLYLDLQLPFFDEILEDYIMDNNNFSGNLESHEDNNELYNLYKSLI